MKRTVKMQECPICGRHNPLTEDLCTGCGHNLVLKSKMVTVTIEEDSSDTPKSPKSPESPESPKPPKRPQKQEEKKPIGKVILGILAVVLVLVAVYLLMPANRGPVPIPTETHLAVETTLPMETTLPRETAPREERVLKNFALNDYADQAYAFGGSYRKDQIATITFVDTLPDNTGFCWDVSQQGNGKVFAWVEPNGSLYDLYIGAEGGVVAPANCHRLFGVEDAGEVCYENLTAIGFNGNFDTANVTDMSYLFFHCVVLKELDLSCFDTSQVENMSFLLHDCFQLETVDLGSFDTSKVINMHCMFASCNNLTALDVTGFDTARVTDMSSMFAFCSKLESLDVTGFDTSRVENMASMFYGCQSLKELDLSNFDLSNVIYRYDMMTGCPAKKIA